VSVRDQGDHAAAGRALTESVQLAESDGDRWRESQSINALGLLLAGRGDLDEALDCFNESLGPRQESGDELGVAMVLGNMGLVAYQQGDTVTALALVGETIAISSRMHARWALPFCLTVCAGVASRHGFVDTAARLYGTVDALREDMGVRSEPRRNPRWEIQCRRDEASARERLGAHAFGLARAAGRRLSLDQAVSEALSVQELTRANSASAAHPRPPTPRELEVARLVARGCTNKQIAAGLVFTQATAAKHVEHILDKLGFTSRSQIAAWVGAEISRVPTKLSTWPE
jgi:non-specific serine/threonine protein kinase